MKSIQEEVKYIELRNSIIRQLETMAEQKGLLRVESDAFEEYTNYIKQNPRQDAKRLVKIADLRGNMFFLRPDITTNIIKQVIPRIGSGYELDLYYLEKVYQYDSYGSIEATRQFGVEIIGKESLTSDIEMVQMIQEVLGQFNLEYIIELGNQQWLNIIFDDLNLSNEKTNQLKQALIAKNKQEVLSILSDNDEVGYKKLLLAIIENQNNITLYKDIITTFDLNPRLLKELDSVTKIIAAVDPSNIEVDLSLLNEFDYYNGPIYRVYVNDYKTSILRGGRYDYLTQDFGKLTPALGFSLDVDVLIKEVEGNE